MTASRNAQLAQSAHAVAAHLQEIGAPGMRALLLFPSGLHFMPVFFGCLCAGVVAVPCYPPKRNRIDSRLDVIATDAGATLVLTTSQIVSEIDSRLSHSPELAALQWVATDTLGEEDASRYREPLLCSETLALLQYTSGSTASPKGVMLSHGNLLYNLDDLDRGWEHTPESVMVTWLPIFHDMGLIYGALLPLFKGFPCVMMPPAAFLQRPLRWLRAISRYRGTHSAAPNFAYDLCVSTTTAEQRAALDLSSWKMTLNAAEPIRLETVERFAEAFAGCGFKASAMCAGYGLAEGTLKITAVPIADRRVTCWVDGAALGRHRVVSAVPGSPGAQAVISCGRSQVDTKVVIVDSERLVKCPPDTVGEIWASGQSIAKGYWNRPLETEETFHARLADTGEGPFLRTGDLGFIKDGECYITGRLKDMIIIRGQNFYPQDIELTVEKSHPALRPSCTAAFGVDVDDREVLAIAQEVERTFLRKLNVNEVAAAIREAVLEKYELEPWAIVLLRTGSIPKTSSGKIQRRACKARFLEGTLEVAGEWHRAKSVPEERFRNGTPPSPEEIRKWLTKQLSQRIRVPVNAFDESVTFSQLGLDSLGVVEITSALEEWLDRTLSPTLLYDYPNIEALSVHLASEKAPILSSINGSDLDDGDTIAIVGMGCRFPGARNPGEFWELLRRGGNGVGTIEFPRYATVGGDVTPLRLTGGFLSQVDRFDAQFFGIAPREAGKMDPQQRLLLEVAWEALECAGIPPNSLAGSETGVFIGISTSDYERLQDGNESALDPYSGTGNAFSIAANRLSYFLDLRGPSWAVDTACSSSLVAVHQACNSLRGGECDLALAGGVNLILSPDLTITFSRAGMLSPTRCCRAFDASADGFVRSEGCGIVALKRLKDALAAKDPILAVIRGCAVNHDGRSNGLTAPSGNAQRALLRRAMKAANLGRAGELSYVEAHGTGTALGDPVELEALNTVFSEGSHSGERCWIGSVKTNLGHLEAAAGIAGLIKVVLALQHREIPPHLHFVRMNPYASLDGSRLTIPTALVPWSPGGKPERTRRAGVSSFGFGGTNAHAILEEAPPCGAAESANKQPERTWQLLALSARSPGALNALTREYARLLGTDAPDGARDQGWPLAGLCASANSGRSHLPWRCAWVSDSTAELHRQLQASASEISERSDLENRVSPFAKRKDKDPGHGGSLRIAFVFGGQGALQGGAEPPGRELFLYEPVFRRALENCSEALRPHLEVSVLDLLYPGENTAAEVAQLLHQSAAHAQPALFALQYALAELWKSWGVEPALVLGHSLGEYAAACVAGLFDLEDALRLVAVRGRLLEDLLPTLEQRGAMAAVFGSREEVESSLAVHGLGQEELTLAAVNGPSNVVLSGRREALEEFCVELAERGVRTHPLEVTHAFHSALVEPMLKPLEAAAATVRFKIPQAGIISNLFGRLASKEELSDPQVLAPPPSGTGGVLRRDADTSSTRH